MAVIGSAAARSLELRRLVDDSRVFSLLRSHHAPVIIAVISEYFPAGTQPRAAGEVYEALSDDLARLRSRGIDMPRSAQQYCGDWVGSGWLIRRPGSTSTGETLEPSEEALIAVDMASRLTAPRPAATASRITSLTERIQSLARDTDPDAQSRLESLYAQRAELEARIEDVAAGEFTLPSTEEISERISDILDSAAAVPADFARVRQDLEDLNRALRRQLLDPEGTRGDVLEDIFRGVDLIGESEAGRSFSGFYAMLLDPERSEYVDAWIRQVLDRDSSNSLSPEVKRRLRRLFRDMEISGAEVSQVLTGLSRSLRHYVTSDEFAEDRRMLELLRQARGAAADAAEKGQAKPLTNLSTAVELIGMSIDSVSRLRLRNPGEERVAVVLEDSPTATVDTAELLNKVRASEIDFEELRNNVLASINRHGTPTIGTVLADHPATQGLASIVGLLHMAMRHGYPAVALDTKTEVDTAADVAREIVTWNGEGDEGKARIPRWFFDERSFHNHGSEGRSTS